MGKIQKYIDPNLSNSQEEDFFILLITFILSSEELFERKTSSHQKHSLIKRNLEISAPGLSKPESERE